MPNDDAKTIGGVLAGFQKDFDVEVELSSGKVVKGPCSLYSANSDHVRVSSGEGKPEHIIALAHVVRLQFHPKGATRSGRATVIKRNPAL